MGRIVLAPMEGVVDWVLRDMLTDIGGIDQCVTEFIRVTQTLHPKAIFYRYAPELKFESKTRAGTPLFVQLLGGNPQPLAENAARAAELGAAGIDLNFGCPAKTVNRHDGGATLLKYPDRIFKIISSVREAVPQHIPVTAKMRLGFADSELLKDNVLASESGGAHWITLHCRTKLEGYKPPAHWHQIPPLREIVKIPIIANGDVFSVKDYQLCRQISESTDVMIGRGLIQNPFLANKIKASDSITAEVPPWTEIRPRLPFFFQMSTDFKSEYFATARTKQWLRQLSQKFPEAKSIFDEVKIHMKPKDFRAALEARL